MDPNSQARGNKISAFVKNRMELHSSLERKTLFLILALSVLVRVGAALYLGDTVEVLPGTHDQVSYDALAKNVVAGKGFVFDQAWYPFTPANTPTAHWSFLYVLYLAANYAVFGYHPLVARLIQAVVVGLLMPWLLYRLGKRTFSPAVGLAAAAGVSVYIYLVYYSAALMTEPFYITLLLWSLDILQRLAQRLRAEAPAPDAPRRDLRLWVELGLAWGLASLLRQQVLLLTPFLLAWLLWATWGRVRFGKFLQSAALTGAVVAAFILPWTVRNYLVYDAFLPLNSNVGWALYAANHPQQGYRFEPLNLPSVPAEWAGLNEAELNTRLTAEGIRFVLEEPGRFLAQTLDRFRNYYRFWPEPTSATISNISRVFSYGLYLPFMLWGLFCSFRLLRRPSAAHAPQDGRLIALLYLYVFTYSAMHLLTWAMHRYRLPVDAVMLVFVGLAWVDLAGRLMGRWTAKRADPGPTPV